MAEENSIQSSTQSSNQKTHNQDYSIDKVMRLKRLIEKHYDPENSKGKRYCILVDHEMIVPTTIHPNDFEGYLEFADTHARVVEVRMFYGNSPKFNRHVFHTSNHSLSGAGQATEFAQEKERWELEHNLLTATGKVKRLKKKLSKVKGLLIKVEEEQGNGFLQRPEVQGALLQAFQFFGIGKQVAPIPVNGVSSPKSSVTVEGIDDESSKESSEFDELVKEYNVSGKKLLNLTKVLLSRPDLMEKLHLEINKSKK